MEESQVKLVLLVLSIVVFIILAILGFFLKAAGVTLSDFFGILGLGLALFAASFLPIP